MTTNPIYRPHRDHHHGLLDLMRLREALDGLQDDGKAKRGEENGVDQGAHHLGPDPAERVFVGGLGLLRETHRYQSHDQRDHVRQRRDPAHHHLHNEICNAHKCVVPLYCTNAAANK
uniref:Uncharacterized protein n=1 Tax=Sinocyclocheilus rhinocerous TaxID=307959 RepID=A0A673HDB5_9TELE